MDKILHHQGWWLSQYLHGFILSRWLFGISSINSTIHQSIPVAFAFWRLQDAERAEELHRCREKVEFLEEELRKTRALDIFSWWGPDSPYVWYNRYTYIDQYLPLKLPIVMMVTYTDIEYLGLEPCFFLCWLETCQGVVQKNNGCLFHTRAWGFLFVRNFGNQFMLPDFCQARVCFQFYMMIFIFFHNKNIKNAFVINITQFLVGTYVHIDPVYPEWMDQVPKVKSMNLLGRGPKKKHQSWVAKGHETSSLPILEKKREAYGEWVWRRWHVFTSIEYYWFQTWRLCV